MILAGDIGATNTRLALFAEEDGSLSCIAEGMFRSQNYPNLDVIVQEFVAFMRVRFPPHVLVWRDQCNMGVARRRTLRGLWMRPCSPRYWALSTYGDQ